MSRRGTPAMISSDNVANFIGLKKSSLKNLQCETPGPMKLGLPART